MIILLMVMKMKEEEGNKRERKRESQKERRIIRGIRRREKITGRKIRSEREKKENE